MLKMDAYPEAAHLLARGCNDPSLRAHWEDPRESRNKLRETVQITRPLGIYFLAAAKRMWVNSMRTVMSFLPNHDCTVEGASCSQVHVMMRVFVRNPPSEENLRQAHVCLKDCSRSICVCDRQNDLELHRQELVILEHKELYFCNFTGRVHVCGKGVCLRARHNVRREDGYQAVCPVTGMIEEASSLMVGSEFWKAGEEVGSASEQRSRLDFSADHTICSDDLSRLIATCDPPRPGEMDAMAASAPQGSAAAAAAGAAAANEAGPRRPPSPSDKALALQKPAQTPSKKRVHKDRELDRFIAARHETTFVHRKKFESSVWLDWAQKFADWEPWLDALMAMDTFQKVETHLKDIMQSSYRKVWGLDGLVQRYAAAVVYASFCPERYSNEDRLASDRVCHLVRRVADHSGPVIYSRLVDKTLGVLTRTHRGHTFVRSNAQQLQLAAGGSPAHSLLLMQQQQQQQQQTEGAIESVERKTGAIVLVGGDEPGAPERDERAALRRRVTQYSQRVLHLWAIVNEQARGLAGAETALEHFPLLHFVFAALDIFADGLGMIVPMPALYGKAGGGEEMRSVHLVRPDEEMQSMLPREWDCIASSGIYQHSYAQTTYTNCVATLISAVKSGRMPRDYLFTYQRQWSDVGLDKAPWIAPLPNKSIFKHPPKRLDGGPSAPTAPLPSRFGNK